MWFFFFQALQFLKFYFINILIVPKSEKSRLHHSPSILFVPSLMCNQFLQFQIIFPVWGLSQNSYAKSPLKGMFSSLLLLQVDCKQLFSVETYLFQYLFRQIPKNVTSQRINVDINQILSNSFLRVQDHFPRSRSVCDSVLSLADYLTNCVSKLCVPKILSDGEGKINLKGVTSS